MKLRTRGFAAALAESLWLSVRRLSKGGFASCGLAAKELGLNGKPEAFRKESGKAANQSHRTREFLRRR
jgi:hypothetical protein